MSWDKFHLLTFWAIFGPILEGKKPKSKSPILQSKESSNKKSARKQTSFKIQFYIGIYASHVENVLLTFSQSKNAT